LEAQNYQANYRIAAARAATASLGLPWARNHRIISGVVTGASEFATELDPPFLQHRIKESSCRGADIRQALLPALGAQQVEDASGLTLHQV